MNSLLPLLALWGNKNWPPRMKLEIGKISRLKEALKDAKGPNQMPRYTEYALSFPFLEQDEFASSK